MREILVGIIISVAIGIFVLFSIGMGNNKVSQSTLNTTEYFRIHIRANSNSTDDQHIKYSIKNDVVEALTPMISEAVSKESAKQIVAENLSLIECVANKTLINAGFSYTSKAKLKTEYFPTRSYDGVILNSGTYDAIIVELGDAVGDNWWCVVYPPMCFKNTSSANIEYKSKILEIIEKFFK